MFKENSDIKALFGFLKNTSEEELAKDSNLSQHANMAFLLVEPFVNHFWRCLLTRFLSGW